MSRETDELMDDLFRLGLRDETPADLARVIERIRDAWRAGEFDGNGDDEDWGEDE